MSIKSTIAAVAASPFLLAGAAFAGPYVNVESNLSYPDGDYSSAATDSIGVYGELSGITDEDSSGDDIVNWGAKLGAKFTF